ncbi:aminoglycoside phosphotransferase family protein [Roseibium algae]|uniref:Aminoglycoside phosphotransferase family protein n=1 Tax=Roseibium algae TaxID=3123038 RepID=A0ABU8TLB5_9HYPH
MIVPDSLAHIQSYPGGSDWLSGLPELFERCVESWDLSHLGQPFGGSNVSLAVPAEQHGQPVVLKIQFPSPECLHETTALSVWNGNGAIRLLDHNPQRSALLLERCQPGLYLADSKTADPLTVITDLLPRLWKPASEPFPSLMEIAHQWASQMPIDWQKAGKPCEFFLVEAALDHLKHLGSSQSEQVLLHQDLHGHNIISAQREPWLVIDPKPLAGEKAFSLAPIVRSFEFGHSRQAALNRLDRLSTDLGLDRERARGWTIAQTMAWSFDSDFGDQHYDTVRWLLGK